MVELCALAVLYVEFVRRLSGGGSTNVFDAQVAGQLSMRVTFVLFTVAYDLVPLALWGRTFGKAVLGLRVVAVGDSGRRLGFGRALLRWIALTFGAVVPYGFLVSVVVAGWALFDPEHRGLHDRLAGTIVLDTGLGSSPVPT